jgi:hypothetical protein
LLDGGASANIIIKNLIAKLGLPKPKLAPYHLKMIDYGMTRRLGIIKNLKIHLHGIAYVATFIILQNNVVDSNYSMLLGLDLGINMQRLHMIGATMSLLFKVME